MLGDKLKDQLKPAWLVWLRLNVVNNINKYVFDSRKLTSVLSVIRTGSKSESIALYVFSFISVIKFIVAMCGRSLLSVIWPKSHFIKDEVVHTGSMARRNDRLRHSSPLHKYIKHYSPLYRPNVI